MSQKETEPKSIGSENKLEVIRKEGEDFVVRHLQTGNILKISDTFAEVLPVVEISPANSFLFFLRI